MNKILGSILINYLILIFLPSALLGDVAIRVNHTFTSGDPVIFKIEAKGGDVRFPQINSIDGFAVQNNGTSNAISIINGKRTQNISKTFFFYPTKSITIPSFKIEVDGAVLLTAEQSVKMIEIKKTKSNNFNLTIKASKYDGYVNEKLKLSLIFKYKPNRNIVDIGLNKPNFDNFWIKELPQLPAHKENGYIAQQIDYNLFPQKDGNLTIPPFVINVKTITKEFNSNYMFGPQSKIQKIYSNSLKFNIKQLPKDIILVGDFKIHASADKKNVEQGEAVSFKVSLTGDGNIDDTPDLKLDISSVTSYDNKPIITENNYTKSFSLVSLESFTIPAVIIKYFNTKSKKVEVLKTNPIKINIKNNGNKANITPATKLIKNNGLKTQEIKKVISSTPMNYIEKIIYFILGILFSGFIYFILKYINNKKLDKNIVSFNIIKTIKKASSSTQLISILAPYIEIDDNLDRIIYSLENGDTINLSLLKKDAIKILEGYLNAKS